ncbi:MAG: flagellar FliJ family protein [Clostridia bacterium]|nr:flagellar FliJ family protein [Clostridia bacterium]
MKRFRFRLERLSHLAAAEKRVKGSELAEARRAQAEAEAEAEERRRVLAQARAEWRKRAEDGEEAELLLAADAWQGRAAEGAQEAARQAEERADEVEERRAEWLRAYRRLSVLDRLRERQKERHALEVARQDQAALDDEASHRKGGESMWI